ncbi:MAG: family 16 glycosylhydrolase [Ignavibacteriae bacterium]|nr:family 16 glycosylhydrolase [Ignavibacteriota bacterium]
MIKKRKYPFLNFCLIVATSFQTIFAKEYKGAEYRTHDTFLYGRFEVSMKPANRVGVISSFFTYHEISSTADWNEIDIENIGRYDDIMQFNTITGGQVNHERNEALSFNQYEEFHIYTFEWTPDYIAWFIDGTEVYRQTGEFVQTVNRAQKLMMNIWNPEYENWVGEWNDYSLPAFSYYDWVSYASHTPGSGNTGTDNNFTSQWHDDFDSFDETRWGKATHTWQGNKCDFVHENAVIKDGKLILCLTNSTNLGYQDIIKPTLVWAKSSSNGNIEIKYSEELDSASAETVSNYNISGVTILSAKVSNDLTKVILQTVNHDPTESVNLIVLNVTDIWGNVIAVAAKTIVPAVYPEFPLSINVGGGAVLGYMPNQEWDESLLYGYLDSHDGAWPANTPITNTDEDIIYTTDGEGTKKYFIKVPNQEHEVTLMFAEKYFNESGGRIFDITIENNLVKSNFDIFSEVGKNAAYEMTKTITVEDELLEIILSPQVNRVVLSGIKINPVPTSVGSNGINPDEYKLFQNYPNPFNPSTEITYTLQNRNHVKLKIYDILGNELTTLVDKVVEAGDHQVTFEQNIMSEEIVSGVYFYQLQTEKIIKTKKMLLLK